MAGWILCFWVDFCEEFSVEEPNGNLEFLGLSCRKNRIGKVLN
jgi:hypothetical protein